MNIISFENFTFKYDSLKTPTLKNINLNIKTGEKLLIAGPSGSGKSTLAHCINGLIPFSYKGDIKGKLTIKDIKPYEKSIYEISEYVGTILQDQDGQFVGLSVGEDVAFSYENNKTELDVMKKGVNKALKAVDMLDYINETPHNLSGGQKQRVSLAGILSTEADILLFDEPLANLDPASGQRAMELIDEVHKNTNKTIIVVEHRIEDVLEHSYDRIIVMNNGEIVADGSPNEILPLDILKSNGLREPLYVEVLKNINVIIGKTDNISNIENVVKYKDSIKSWYEENDINNETKKSPILSLKNIDFKYFNDGPKILKKVSFDIERGNTLAILGNNGAGKSTLLKVIAGLEKLKHGEIILDGELINDWSVRKRASKIGYVMQNPNHMITKNMIFDEVAFGLRNFGIKESEINDRVEDTLKTCGLYKYRKWPISALSYGQKKRVTIASILAMKPEVIILDEPTAGQDYKNYREFMSYLDNIKQQGISIVMITHDMHLALEYSDSAVVLSEGEVISNASVYDVLSDNEIISKANLKQTSLSKLASLCEIQNTSGFIKHYINKHKGGMAYE